MRRLQFLFLIAALLCLGCEQRHPPGFVILKGAEGLKTFYVRGIDKSIYRVHSEFPADNIIREISDRMKKDGWEPLDNLYLYPDTPSGKIQGWTYYEQAKKTGFMVYEWTTDWKDKDNNIASYALQYRDPIEKYRQGTFIMRPSNDALTVNFVYMPAKEAVAIRETVKPKEAK